MAAESPPGKILSRPQSLTAKLVCFRFASANHIAGNHIVRIVYFPDWLMDRNAATTRTATQAERVLQQ